MAESIDQYNARRQGFGHLFRDTEPPVSAKDFDPASPCSSPIDKNEHSLIDFVKFVCTV
jgi:hypothetical protein